MVGDSLSYPGREQPVCVLFGFPQQLVSDNNTNSLRVDTFPEMYMYRTTAKLSLSCSEMRQGCNM